MKKSLTFILILLAHVSLRAQSEHGTISGRVVNEQNQPLSYASVALYKVNDSLLVKGSLTDIDGKYGFSNVIPGEYYLQVSWVGYQKLKTATLKLDGATALVVASIQLKSQVNQLGEVTVTSTKPLIENQIDKMVMNVENSVLAAGNTAMELLQKAPGVSVDKDGNISLQGKSGVQLMIDGKPTYLSTDQLATLMRTTDASNIQLIEIMTNPSSKYDAEGNSGIINIKLKKNQNFGSNATLTIGGGYGTYHKIENSISMNHRQKSFNVFSNYSFGDRGTYFLVAHDRQIEGSVNDTFIDVSSYIHMHAVAHNYKAGVDFYLNKKSTLGFIAGGNTAIQKRDLDGLTRIGSVLHGIDSSVVTKSTGPRNYTFGSYNMNYKLVLDTLGSELLVNVDYLRSSSKEDYDYASHYNTLIKNDFRNPLIYRTGTPILADVYSAKIDFAHPFSKKAKMEAGLKSSYVVTDNSFIFEQLGAGSKYLNDPRRSNNFKYSEIISAGYLTLNTEPVKDFTLQAGLRVENTNSQGNSLTMSSTVSRNYLDFFPTLYLRKKLPNKNTIGASYSRRIDRPTYTTLNPFVYFIDEYSFTQGNPYLNPQYTDSYQVSYVLKDRYILGLNYRHTSSVMTQVFFVNPDSKALYETRLNMAKQDYFNLTLNAPLTVGRWLQGNNNIVLFHNNFISPNLNGLPFSLARTSFQFNSTNTINISRTMTAELNGGYFSPAANGALNVSSFFGIDFGINRSFLQKQLNLKLALNDIFDSRPRRTSASALPFTKYNYSLHSRYESRVARLSLSWKIGNTNVKVVEKTGGSEVERNRL